MRDVAPDAVVSDILTLAPALAGELEGVPVGTVIPHLDPRMPPGSAPYSCGARLPRTRAGRALWRGADPLLRHGLQLGRSQLNETRRRLGLPALERVHGGISDALALVATFPQLEYPRAWPAGTHVVGPLMWEPPAPDVELPPGDEPLVLIAPSTSQDPGRRCCARALEGLAELPVRVLASANRQIPPVAVPANARLVDWVSYSRTMPACDARRLPRRARHRRARARQRLRRRDRAGGGRHERERGARGLGGRRRAAAAAARRRARAGARGRARARTAASCAWARAGCRRGRRATTAPARAADLVEAFAAGARSARVSRAPDERAVDAAHAGPPGAVLVTT